jgi:hypothetical protein
MHSVVRHSYSMGESTNAFNTARNVGAGTMLMSLVMIAEPDAGSCMFRVAIWNDVRPAEDS